MTMQTKPRTRRAACYVVRGVRRTDLLSDGSARVVDEYAHNIWDRYRRNPDVMDPADLPRVLVEIEMDGKEHLLKTYPDD